MNDVVLKYIGQIISSFIVILALAGFRVASTVSKQSLEIDNLKDQVMNVELINEKFLNIENNFKELKINNVKRDEKLDEKLDKILEKL